MTKEHAGGVVHINILGRLKSVLLAGPSEWLGLIRIAIATFVCRFVLRIAEPGVIVGAHTRLMNPKNISIGRGSLILDNVYCRPGPAGQIRIGKRCAINSYAKIFGHGGVVIGDDTQIGPDALITTTSHDFRNGMAAEFKPVRIGDWAWIGAKAIILPGVTVGDRAIVGAGSVVTKDVAEGDIVVGNPARKIGTNDMQDST